MGKVVVDSKLFNAIKAEFPSVVWVADFQK